ncbi:daf-6 [Cordylochernes scorpioides]|uniref:Daf-6 n=1 Tax=Cordylochernes scorpioides TaxID=51811 RepID=A0ABY6KJW4_9ARAC|nr:daf-6 [Cordylochernes scorpioides]
MSLKKFIFISQGLTRAFRNLGALVARRPWWFIIGTIIFTALSSLGCINVKIDGDLVKLFGSSYHRVRKMILHNFPPSNQEHYDFSRDTKFTSGYGRLLLETLDGGSTFRKHILDEILRIERAVRSMLEEILRVNVKIKYPLDFKEGNLHFHYNGAALSGVTLDPEENVLNTTKAQLIYFLNNLNPEIEALIPTWEKSFLDLIEQTPLQYLRIFKMANPAITKPWLGVFGCLSSLMGVVAGCGICLMMGLTFPTVNLGVPFLLLAIGIDDTFIFLAAWRATDPKDSVEKRLAHSYERSAVSVTLTSMTNCASFLACAAMPYLAIRIFGIYAMVCSTLVYIYQLTFMGDLIALT